MSSLSGLWRLAASYRSARRFRRILGVLARHGFADVASRTGLRRLWGAIRLVLTMGRARDQLRPSTGERLRKVCEELGPTFVKFGQVLASRKDLLPEDVTTQLARLQDQVPPFPFEKVQEVLEREIPESVDEVFARIDPEPIAAASIAQVHRAELTDGTQVVLKVMRPGIRKTVQEDLSVLKMLARYLKDNVDEISHMRPVELVEEFARTLTLEMDFHVEVRNMERFKANFAHDDMLIVPQAFKKHCGRELIVMEYVKGCKVTETKCLKDYPITNLEVAQAGTRLLLESIFEHRFFHADPHPGNWLITPEGRICLLDFGMMGSVPERRMEEMLSFMVALVSNDAEMLVDVILKAGLAPSDLDRRGFARDIDLMMTQFASLHLEDMQIEEIMRSATNTVFKHRIQMPTDLLMVGRALGTMEGIAREIHPQFAPLEAVQPYLISTFLKRALDPSVQSAIIMDGVLNWASLLKRLPSDVEDLTLKLKEGRFRIQVEDPDAGAARLESNRRANRAIGAGLTLGGGVLSVHLMNFPGLESWIAPTCIGLTALMGLWVLRGVFRSGGM